MPAAPRVAQPWGLPGTRGSSWYEYANKADNTVGLGATLGETRERLAAILDAEVERLRDRS